VKIDVAFAALGRQKSKGRTFSIPTSGRKPGGELRMATINTRSGSRSKLSRKRPIRQVRGATMTTRILQAIGNAGHRYPPKPLSEGDQKALLEYLETL
jgi:hypothetical protein